MIIPFGKKTWFDLDLIKCNIMPCLNTYAYKIWTHCTLFFIAFFSATLDGSNLIFGHKLHIGMPYNRYWEKCDKKYLGRTEGRTVGRKDRQTDKGKTVCTPPPTGSGGIKTVFWRHKLWQKTVFWRQNSDKKIVFWRQNSDKKTVFWSKGVSHIYNYYK
jgi:hypothetical protein